MHVLYTDCDGFVPDLPVFRASTCVHIARPRPVRRDKSLKLSILFIKNNKLADRAPTPGKAGTTLAIVKANPPAGCSFSASADANME
jgi:hypothetical protein